MKRLRAIRHLNQAGVSLVELMIAIVIGLLITFLVTNYYLSSRQSQQITAVTSELLDEQRYAMQAITQQLLLAGYSDYWFSRDAGFGALAAIKDETLAEKGEEVSADKNGAPAFAPGELVKAKSNILDEVWLRFQPAALERQTIKSCQGESLRGDSDHFMVMRLFVDGTELKCQRADKMPDGILAKSPTTLLSHIETLAFTYLDDSDEFQNPEDVIKWSEVRAIKIDLLLASEDKIFDASIDQKYPWPDGTTKTCPERKMCSRSSRIVALRNALGQSQ